MLIEGGEVMFEDNLVNEIRARRVNLMEKFDFDAQKILKFLQQQEKNENREIVSQVSVVKSNGG
jgi:hypothetical protein